MRKAIKQAGFGKPEGLSPLHVWIDLRPGLARIGVSSLSDIYALIMLRVAISRRRKWYEIQGFRVILPRGRSLMVSAVCRCDSRGKGML